MSRKEIALFGKRMIVISKISFYDIVIVIVNTLKRKK